MRGRSPPSQSLTPSQAGADDIYDAAAAWYFDGHLVVSEFSWPTNVALPCSSTATITARPAANGSGTIPVYRTGTESLQLGVADPEQQRGAVVPDRAVQDRAGQLVRLPRLRAGQQL